MASIGFCYDGTFMMVFESTKKKLVCLSAIDKNRPNVF